LSGVSMGPPTYGLMDMNAKAIVREFVTYSLVPFSGLVGGLVLLALVFSPHALPRYFLQGVVSGAMIAVSLLLFRARQRARK